MTLAKSSLEIARELPRARAAGARAASASSAAIAAEHERTVDAVLAIVEAERAARPPAASLQRSIELRNPYVDPMNAIQVELLRRYRGRRRGGAACRCCRSIAGIAAALRNTG